MSRTLGIVGVGLIGGSVGLAAGASGWDVVGVDRPEVLEEAQRAGAIHRASTLKEVRGADLVVLAAPISRVTTLIGDLAPTEALITDVASAKGAIVNAAENHGLRFVGGHPMAGSQLAGVANARANLFEGARYFLTPTGHTDPDDYREVSGFVRELGAVPTAVDPEKHDLLVAALAPAAPHGRRPFEGRLGYLPRSPLLRGTVFQGPDEGGGLEPRTLVGHPGRERAGTR